MRSSSPVLSFHTLVLLGALLAPSFSSRPDVHVRSSGATGALQGIARSADDSAPIPFALIRVQLADDRADTPGTMRQAITSASGRFWIDSVPAGTYRLQLLRIGYRPVASPVVRVVAGETTSHDFRVPTLAVQLAAVVVLPEGTCLSGDQLSQAPRLAELWSEARKGVEIRRGFELQYRFRRVLRQSGSIKWRFMSRPISKVDTVVNEPDSVPAREAKRRALRRAEGYSKNGFLSLPNEQELLHDDFLLDHCLEASVASGDGELGLRFRPTLPRREGTAIRGTIWVDASTYMVRHLEVEWLDGSRSLGESRIDYGDVYVAGSALRLPVGGRAVVRPSGVTRIAISKAEVAIRFEYGEFAPVQPRR